MKEELKIDFVDLWKDFDKTNNFFFHLLSTRYRLVITDSPDLLIFSGFGNKHLQYNCTKLFYTGENWKTNFNACDYSISFENLPSIKQYQLPNYVIRVLEANSLHLLLKQKSMEEAHQILEVKSEFCCTVVSNPSAHVRNDFFEKLNTIKKVNSGGRFRNNIGGPVADKLEFCKNHKFVFAFENQRATGYTTEKLTDALLSDAIPIYSGDPDVAKTFNSKRFLNFDEYKNAEDLIVDILELDTNDTLFKKKISQPVFVNNQAPDFFDASRLLNFITTCIEDETVKKKQYKIKKNFRYYVERKYNGLKRRLNFKSQ
ncbi:hypothetical protein AAU57_13015 [Nonlabens sp. YIK11]|uniref:glycosyltransferase family 10 domain-containing protein n=1 Tax=Nonlabens sp. YIK11 TaxID=1453349 RepID=UPI0006DC5F92|nr:glycosyltransferase family 10 [Nonlabens sp. YIK11]KQC34150.1 hypothetical protein AAU57_13015 [Nonlabens sp. YIK11]